ncbi:hypothetical protein P7F60_02205 [Rhizobium sp. YJ-22]|uniref:hypothetical protein n=1 Tax=Rhizobium sp. YJ-22 TaxID=3037556 RepID=UPI002412DB57|nr:hypothetical protein [Rhizobium sp. YJ-22]MDG3575186.1 hypothetical protein [Rhizobium sp. YJ-22]
MGPESRSKKLKRLVNVQRQLEKIAESDLAATARQRREVAESMEVVIEAIGAMDGVHRLFAQNYAERFGRLTLRDQQLTGVQRMQEIRVLRERTKGDRLEGHMKEARMDEDRLQADESIYDLIDMQNMLATPASSKLEEP